MPYLASKPLIWLTFAGTLAHYFASNTMEGLNILLGDGFNDNKPHVWARNSSADCLRVVDIV
jgi:hypothetical protein